jgi:hypothetical protein
MKPYPIGIVSTTKLLNMNKSLLIIAALVGSFYTTFAGNGAIPAPESKMAEKQWLFKPLSTNDVSMELERLDGDVMVYLFSQNMKNVDMIYVEKSKDPTDGFTRCKTVKVSDHLLKSKSYISVVDESPYSANTDSYYRIRTVTAAGANKIYPVVGLSPILSIESETVDNSK